MDSFTKDPLWTLISGLVVSCSTLSSQVIPARSDSTHNRLPRNQVSYSDLAIHFLSDYLSQLSSVRDDLKLYVDPCFDTRAYLHGCLIIMELGRIFVRINFRNWPENTQRTRTKLLIAVRGVISTGISIISLRNEGFPTFCLCLSTRRHLGFTEKLRNSRSWRLFAHSSWGNAATAFSLSLQFYICGCEWYKLYSGKRCTVGEGKRLRGETVGLQYPAWLLRNSDSAVKNARNNKCLFVGTSLLTAMRLSIIRSFTLHQTGYRHSIHHGRSNN